MPKTSRTLAALAAAPLLITSTISIANASPPRSPHKAVQRSHVRRAKVAPAVTTQVARRGAANVVVVLRGNQAVKTPDTKQGHQQHAAALAAARAPVLNLLHRAHRATDVHAYRTFDAISAHVTQAGLNKLAASPDVALVAPNATIHLGTPPQPTAAETVNPAVAKAVTPPGGVCSSTTPQLAPEALQTTRTASDDPNAKTARSLGATGAGVKVAFMAEGIDVNNPDFIRADGSKVFVDYQDFSGDGTSATTDSGEAFIDAGSIAAQGRKTYNVQHYSDLPTAKACKIRVQGIAPGASLVDLKVFGNTIGTTSGFLQAIDYAVDTDHVDVLSESFGYNPVPDTTADVIKVADEAAVAAGVTVTVSTGDAGITNTIGSPATSPGVISTGATTTYRFDLQSGYGGARFPGVKHYLSNNISSLSSGGTTESGTAPDLVAPGELNWGICTADPVQYYGCTSLAGAPSDLEDAGGTSESAPLTAGGAALVIQAYRQAHNNHSPTPAQVKQILVSTANDVDAPADQQGVGELNTYRAVLAARSITGNSVTPTRQGSTYVTDTGQVDAVGAAGTAVSKQIQLTNTGTAAQTIALTGRSLGAYTAFKQQKVSLSKSSPTQIDWQGYKDPYQKVTFTVPAGVSRLDAAIAYRAASADITARGRLTLVAPHGALAAYSLPQGIGNYGDVQVANPRAGTWTAYVYSRPAAAGGSLGTYVFGFRTAKYVSFGHFSPTSLTLAPGASGSTTFTTATPTTPGDTAGSIVLKSTAGARTTIPVVLRTTVPLSTAGTPFQGTLTGGNGREASTGQSAFYQFDVASGTPELNATVSLANNPDNPFFVSLIDPNGDQVAAGSNEFQANLDSAPTANLSGVVHALNPAAGRWDLVVTFAPVVSGTALSQPFQVLVNSQPQTAVTTGLPTSTNTTLPAGQPVTAEVMVTNTTKSPEAYFVDARRSGSTTYQLASPTPLSLPSQAYGAAWLVPTESTQVTDTLTSTVPVEFDYGPSFGDPDLASDTTGMTATGTYTAPVLTQGVWYLGADEVGPYGAVGQPQVSANASMSVHTRTFDTTVTSRTGDLWSSSIDPNAADVKPVVVQPGHSTTIGVTITPQGAAGSTVSGTLYVDDLASVTTGGVSPSANEVLALPYTYKIG